jgi:hypothetical protein
MLHALYKRWHLEQERRDYRSGQITAAIYNVNRGKKGKWMKPQDFMPHWKEPPAKQMNVEETVAYVATLNRLLGGVDLRGLDG